MEAKDRIKAILDYYHLSINDFVAKTHVRTGQAVYDLLSGKTKSISQSMENKILSYFQDINRIWLLTGEGNMFGNNNSISQRVDNNSGVITNNIGAKDNTTTTNNTTNNYAECDKNTSNLSKAIDEIAEQRKLVSKAQEQIDRLITLLENK
ncbi:MAG: hypothetical protein ACTTI2_06125 [Bacteroidales bacterium]